MEYSLSDLKSVSGKGRTVIVFGDWGLHIECYWKQDTDSSGRRGGSKKRGGREKRLDRR